MLKNLGFKNVEHYKSSTENYPDCLNRANIDILENNLDVPILILEDDIEWLGIEEIEYDPYCDAIYFGLSKSAGHPTENKDEGWALYENWSPTTLRIKNMLSTHAILYNSRKYKEAVISLLKSNLGTKNHTDVQITRIQSNFLVLASKHPVFYQSAKFNDDSHAENWTKFQVVL